MSQIDRPEAVAEASLEDLATELQKTGELARAELARAEQIGAKSREGLVVVTGADAVVTTDWGAVEDWERLLVHEIGLRSNLPD